MTFAELPVIENRITTQTSENLGNINGQTMTSINMTNDDVEVDENNGQREIDKRNLLYALIQNNSTTKALEQLSTFKDMKLCINYVDEYNTKYKWSMLDWAAHHGNEEVWKMILYILYCITSLFMISIRQVSYFMSKK